MNQRRTAYLAKARVTTPYEELSGSTDRLVSALLETIDDAISAEKALIQLGRHIRHTVERVSERVRDTITRPNERGELQNVPAQYDMACSHLAHLQDMIITLAQAYHATQRDRLLHAPATDQAT